MTGTLAPFVTNIENILTGIVLGVATIFLILGAFQYMAAMGNQRGVERGKTAMIAALAGYAIVVGVKVITTIIDAAVKAAGG